MAKTTKKSPKTISHHVKHAWHVTPKFVHGAAAGAFVSIVVLASFGTFRSADALSIDTSRDCDDYAVIHCGALTAGELQERYRNKGVSEIYSHFGISAADIASIGTTAAAGNVHDDGRVTVNGKTVATNATTASRLNINGSSKITEKGVTFYVRPVKVSFARSTSPAYVVSKNGVFQYAVLASCGNPVSADATVTPKPVPTPTPAPPAAPAPTPPSPQPIITPPALTIQPSTDASVLPNTGPGALVIIAAATVIGGIVTHKTHHHLKRRRHAQQAARSLGRTARVGSRRA